MTFWTIVRSSLIYGGDLRSSSLTADDVVLLTNPEVVAVATSTGSANNRPVTLTAQQLSAGGLVTWTATSEDRASVYVAFLTNSSDPAATATVTFDQLNITVRCSQ